MFLQVRWPNQQCQSTEGGWLVIQIALNLTRLISPCYNNNAANRINWAPTNCLEKFHFISCISTEDIRRTFYAPPCRWTHVETHTHMASLTAKMSRRKNSTARNAAAVAAAYKCQDDTHCGNCLYMCLHGRASLCNCQSVLKQWLQRQQSETPENTVQSKPTKQPRHWHGVRWQTDWASRTAVVAEYLCVATNTNNKECCDNTHLDLIKMVACCSGYWQQMGKPSGWYATSHPRQLSLGE